MTSLEREIATHRELLRAELNFNPSQSRPPVAFTYDEAERAMVPDDRPLVYFTDEGVVEVPDSATQSTQVGMPMSGRMLKYLQGPAPETPWAMALSRLKFHCRKEHPYHRNPSAPAWRGSLCWQLVYFVVVAEFSVENAAKILRYDNPEPALRYALTYIEASIDRMRERAERRAKEDEGRFSILDLPRHEQRHDQPGMHQDDCPQCRAA